jgi:broad specificity phosphatase PhoE
MNTTLLVVRHAQTTSNVNGRYMGWLDEDLNDEGVMQATRLSRRLSRRPIAAVFSSPLKRASRTAELLAHPHRVPVQQLHDLGEIRIGAWEGMFAREIEAKFPELWRTWRTDPSTVQMPAGESLSQVSQRAIVALKDMLRENQGRQVLAVTHDVVVRILVSYCLNVSTAIYRRLEAANSSLTVIQCVNGTYRLRLLNDTAHLEYDPVGDEAS